MFCDFYSTGFRSISLPFFPNKDDIPLLNLSRGSSLNPKKLMSGSLSIPNNDPSFVLLSNEVKQPVCIYGIRPKNEKSATFISLTALFFSLLFVRKDKSVFLEGLDSRAQQLIKISKPWWQIMRCLRKLQIRLNL